MAITLCIVLPKSNTLLEIINKQTNTTVVRFVEPYIPHLLRMFSTTSPYLPHFLAFIWPVQQKTLPCTPPSTPVPFHFISMAVWSGHHAGPKSISSHRRRCLYWGIQHAASHPSIRKEKRKHCITHKAKRTQHKTHLSERGCISLISQNAGEGHVSWCIFSTVDSWLHRGECS